MNILAWLIVGVIASDIGALIAWPDGGRGHRLAVALGAAAALVGGFFAGQVVGMKDAVQGVLEPAALLVAGAAAVLTVAAQAVWRGRGIRRLAGNEPPAG